jgi:hypothetical protein
LQTVIDRGYHIDRGYEGIEERLAGLGAALDASRDVVTGVPAVIVGSFSLRASRPKLTAKAFRISRPLGIRPPSIREFHEQTGYPGFLSKVL